MTMGGGFPSPGPVAIRTARRSAGGAWGATEQLSTANVDAGYDSALAIAPTVR
jgi:hypothetical protein